MVQTAFALFIGLSSAWTTYLCLSEIKLLRNPMQGSTDEKVSALEVTRGEAVLILGSLAVAGIFGVILAGFDLASRFSI